MRPATTHRSTNSGRSSPRNGRCCAPRHQRHQRELPFADTAGEKPLPGERTRASSAGRSAVLVHTARSYRNKRPPGVDSPIRLGCRSRTEHSRKARDCRIRGAMWRRRTRRAHPQSSRGGTGCSLAVSPASVHGRNTPSRSHRGAGIGHDRSRRRTGRPPRATRMRIARLHATMPRPSPRIVSMRQDAWRALPTCGTDSASSRTSKDTEFRLVLPWSDR